MSLRTAKEYLEGLDDSRAVYVRGESVNVLQHPGFRIPLAHGANVYDFAQHPDTAELSTFLWEGERLNRHFQPLDSIASLRLRSRLIEEHTRRCRGTLNLTKAVGTDAIAGLSAVVPAIDEKHSTSYGARVDAFHRFCAVNDLSLAVAQTDVKGDRSLPPHQQHDPDMYVRIVSQSADGIIVRGAKAHTTMAPLVDEIIVLPTRSMAEADRDYAVSFAIPPATEGLHMICGPLPDSSASVFDRPVSSRNVEMETLTVFDDVFVPYDRVFLAREHEFAGQLALSFATFHRFTAISYKLPMAELLLGMALEITDSNGIGGSASVRDKLAELALYGQLLRACVIAAAEQGIAVNDTLVKPNPAFTSAGKLHFASLYHQTVKIVQDLAGGLAITAPWAADLHSGLTATWVKKYMAGGTGIDPVWRFRLFQLIRDVTASDFAGYNEVVTLHGEGSLRAQSLQLLASADTDGARAAVRAVLDDSPR